jgi:murein endopeptidase
MRVLAVVLSCLLLATAIADARPQRRPAKQQPQKPAKAKQHAQKQAKPHPQKQAKRAPMKARPEVAKAHPRVAVKPASTVAKPAPTVARPAPTVAKPAPVVAEQVTLVAAEQVAVLEPRPIDPYADLDADPALAPRPGPRGQSIGAPWAGRLQDATRLQLGDGAYIRRPHRAFGTRTTVEHIRRAVLETLAAHPDAHVLAIGDLSAERGGWISEHSSHRSGRDVDLGLFYKHPPDGYPASFVNATAETLDRAATWTLLVNLLATHGEDGGVQMIFLDYGIQGLLYRWAKENGVKERVLAPIFQYPNGRWANALVRHEPHHADHLHVRFRCAKADTACY